MTKPLTSYAPGANFATRELVPPELQQRLRNEQVRLLYRNSDTGFAVTVIVGALLAFGLSPHIAQQRLAIWFGALLLITLLRFVLTRLYDRAQPANRQARIWEIAFLLGAGLTGLVWGTSIIFLFPAEAIVYQLFVALVLSGMVGGSVAVLSARKSAYLVFACPVLFPVVIRFAVMGDPVHTVLAVMTFVYLTAMTITAMNTEQAIWTALALRFDNQELAAQVAERTRVEQALRNSEERFRDFTESAADFFWELDAGLRFVDVSERFQEITGLSRDQVLGNTVGEVFAGYGGPAEGLAEQARCLENRMPFGNSELYWMAPDARQRTLLLSGKPIFDDKTQFSGYRGVGRDVTDERRIAELMAHQAKHDALTGLVNRREFMRRLETALAHSKHDGAGYVVCYLDLDQFKIVNDTVGHAAGDELLKQLTGTLLSRIRARDTLSRLGGDEFALLLENCQLEVGVQIAESLLAALASFRFVWESRVFQIGASIGVVPITGETGTALHVLSQADLACYAAKDLGRNRIYVYHSGSRELARLEDEMALVSDLQDALKHDRFKLYWQPIWSLVDNRIDSYELLLRLQRSTTSLLQPRSFIPAAERYGIMKDIDRWVIERAASAHTQLARTHSDIHLSLNLSGSSLDDEGLLQWVIGEFSRSGTDLDRICFEITETAAVRNLNQAQTFISELKGRGCRFALDDFGSGLSSFAYLRHLPVDFLKIDGSFVRDMEHDATAGAMVAAINEIGQALKIRTVAEYVDSQASLDLVRDIGVDLAQGYVLGEPAPMSVPV